MKHLGMLVLSLSALILTRCNPLPPDPSTLPENASISVTAVDVDSDYKQPVKVNEATTISVTFELHLPGFIDSVTADIESAEGDNEFHTVLRKPWDTTAFKALIQFPSSGVKTLVCTAWITGGIEKTESIIFNVASRIANAAPVFKPATIELFSKKGSASTCNLMAYVTDPEHDRLLFERQGREGDPVFLLKDSLLSSTADIEAGTYVISVTVSDGKLSDAGTIIWKVFTPPQGASVIADDEVQTVRNTPVTIDVLENDDVQSGAQLSWCSQGMHGKTFLRDGKVNYTPDNGYVGSDTLLYVVNGSDTGRVYVSVKAATVANRSPVLSPDTIEIYSPEGVSTVGNIAGYAQDPDNDALIFTVTPPEGAAFVVKNAVVASLDELQTGTWYCAVDVFDGQEHARGVIKWTVFRDDGSEVRPVADVVLARKNVATPVAVLDNDDVVSGAGALYVTSVSQGAHGTVYVRNGAMVVYKSVDGFSGNDTVEYVVNIRDTGWIYITVPDGSLALDDTLTVQGNRTGRVNVLVNDVVLPDFPQRVVSVTKGTLGDASVEDDSIVVYQAKPGAKGADTLLYRISTGDTARVVVTVAPADYALTPDTVSLLQGRSREFMVLVNDRISEGSLKVTGVTGCDKGTAAFTDSSILFTAKGDAEGTCEITYTVNYGSASAGVIVTVLAIELTANTDSVTIDEDAGAVTVDVLANDRITGGEAMTLTAVSGAKLGTAVLDAVKKGVVYTPGVNRNGRDTVRYTVNNAVDGVFFVTIRPVNDLPVFTYADTVATVPEASRDTLRFAATDADGTPVGFSLADAPQWVSMVGTADSVSVVAAPAYSVVTDENEAVFKFTVRGVSGSDTIVKTVTVTVANVAAAPSFETASATVTVREGESKTVTFTATDPQNDPLTYSVAGVPDWITATTAGGIKLVVNPGFALVSGTESAKSFDLTLSASDGTYSATCAVTVVVADSNSVPVFTDTVRLVTMDEGATKTLVFKAKDAQGDKVTYAVTPAATGWITVAKEDSIVLKLSPGYTVATSGSPITTLVLTLSADDGSGPVSRELEIRVSNVGQKITVTSFPATGHVRMGDSLVTDAIVAGNEPVGGTMSYVLTSAPAAMVLSPDDHRIRWYLPRENYVVNQQIAVTVRFSNGDVSKDSTFKIVVDPHRWNLVNSSLLKIPDAYTYVAAVGKDTVFLTEGTTVAPDYHTEVYRSTDGGKTWPSVPHLSVGGLWTNATDMDAKGDSVYLFFVTRYGSRRITFPWNGDAYGDVSAAELRAWDVSPDGKRFMTSEVEFPYGTLLTSYRDNDGERFGDTLFSRLGSIACGNEYIWGIDSNTQLWYMKEYSTADSLHGFDYHPFYTGGEKVYCDNNNGDTAFVVRKENAEIYQVLASGSYLAVTLPKVPEELTMLSGKVGWFRATDGTLYFTNEGFRSVIAESLLDETDQEVVVTGVARSSDGKTMYAYAKDSNGKIRLFRY